MEGLLLFLFSVAIAVIIVLVARQRGYVRESEEKYRTEARTGVELAHQRYFAEAQKQLEEWKQNELKAISEQGEKVLAAEVGIIKEKMILEIEQWKEEYEAGIRADAIARSHAVILGRATENLIPYMPLVFPYNPKEARFIGSPIDMIVFDGVDDGELREVVFLEIKSGDANLSARQRQIRDAIQNHRVVWRELHLPQPQTQPGGAL